ncbi:MAG: hypothetical protein U0Z75_09130, partial [Deinococcaceae bacterium]
MSNILPLSLTLASPSLFARQGSGVSRVPLQVLAFNAPGFGEIQDALNLANGNLFLSFDQLSNNSQPFSNPKSSLFSGSWSLSSRLRLYGFDPDKIYSATSKPVKDWPLDTFTSPHSWLSNTDLTGPSWPGYVSKPSISTPNTSFSTFDSLPRPNPETNQSGVQHIETVTVGEYVISFDAVSLGADLNVQFGMGPKYRSSVNLSSSWKTYTATFNITSSNTLFEIFESSVNNPKWQVRNVSVKRKSGTSLSSNLISNQNFKDDSYWKPKALKPSITAAPPTFAPSADSLYSRMSGIDLIPQKPTGIGTPTLYGPVGIFFSGRTLEPYPLDIYISVCSISVRFSLTPTEQNFEYSFPTPITDFTNCRVRIHENTFNNSAWEIKNLKVIPFAYQNGSSYTQGDDIITKKDFTDPAWLPISPETTKPLVFAQTFESADFNDPTYVDPYANSSGFTLQKPLSPGTYTVSFRARTQSSSLPISFSMGDLPFNTTTLSSSWQDISKTFTLSSPSDTTFSLFESTKSNPDWEIDTFKISQSSSTLLENPDFRTWSSYPVSSPPIQIRSFRLSSQDFPTSPPLSPPERNFTSGLYFEALQQMPPGKYSIKFKARSIGSNLNIRYGLNSFAQFDATLTPSWQSFSKDIDFQELLDPTAPRENLAFHLFESTKDNVPWELSDIQVQHLATYVEPSAGAPSSLNLGLGDGTTLKFDLATIDHFSPPSSPSRTNFQWTTLPSWLQPFKSYTSLYYPGPGKAFFYRITPQPGLNYSQDW